MDFGPLVDRIQYKRIEGGKETSGRLEMGGGDILPISTSTDTTSTDTSSGSRKGKGNEEKKENLRVNPTIFTGQPEDSRIMKEEAFGPVVVINTFKTEEEVIAKANDTMFGLYAALYSAYFKIPGIGE